MIRTMEGTGKSVEEARAAACALLGVDVDDMNVSYEVLEMPRKAGFLGLKTLPARVKVTVELPDKEKTPAAAPVEQPKQEKKPAPKPAAPVEKPVEAPAVAETKAEEPAAAVTAAEEPAAPAEKEETPVIAQEAEIEGEEIEVPIDIENHAKVKAAVEYLREVIRCMGVAEVNVTAIQKGEATIIRLDGEKLGALIGRRGETMESLSYLASLVANRMEGDYIKLGLDVAGYRGKREQDLTALAQRIGAKVRKTGRSFAMEPMNPYERRIIHSAIGKMEGVRSESKGEGRDRRVVIYSTAPDAQTENTYGERRSNGGRGGYRGGNNNRSGNRGPRRNDRGERPERSGEGERAPRGGNRGPRSNGGRGGYRGGSRNDRGPRPSAVPERNYVARDAENAAPVAPKRTERVDDFAGFSFGKIEL